MESLFFIVGVLDMGSCFFIRIRELFFVFLGGFRFINGVRSWILVRIYVLIIFIRVRK